MEILVNDEERVKVLHAITALNSKEHISYMSLQMLADCARLKLSKTRLVVDTLVREQLITKYNVTDKQVRPRYYYVLNESALQFLEQAANKDTSTV